jgi:hypothetical protein
MFACQYRDIDESHTDGMIKSDKEGKKREKK